MIARPSASIAERPARPKIICGLRRLGPIGLIVVALIVRRLSRKGTTVIVAEREILESIDEAARSLAFLVRKGRQDD